MASILPAMKARLEKGDTLYGLFLCSFSPVIAEISGYAGYDFVVVDMEHGYGGISTALPCLHALAATATPAILRLPECSQTWAKKALDLGPQGVMFPMIDTPEQARRAVSYCRYPPNGLRGAAHPVIRASRYGIDEEYLSKCETDLFVMCQVESMEGVRNVREIAAVDGVDCIQIGPLDLSASLGELWDPVNEKVKNMMNGAEEAVIGLRPNRGDGVSGPYLAGFAMANDGPNELRARGYHMVAGGVDIGLYRAAAVDDVKKFKMGLNLDAEIEGTTEVSSFVKIGSK
ncbi:uncharacterized protein LOC105156040 [Sesamum indicum]|uniref:Uncharacterized protein LOC105156040 n=1 Tax=Sesamum indicum TaxID=4182 RepID=A0A6I9SKF7_SESIN|nr:uncharacterized protein LOC105156040 [Sesamum indicum]